MQPLYSSMKLQLTYIIVFLLLAQQGSTQTLSVDSLEKQLSLTVQETQQLPILSQLAWKLRDFDLKKALNYGLTHLNLAEKLHQTSTLAKTYNYVGVIYRNLGSHTKALKYYYKALKAAKKHDQKSQVAYAYNNIGEVLKIQQRPEEAKKNVRKAILLFRRIHHKKGEAYGYLRLGEILQDQKKYAQALKAFLTTKSLREQIPHKPGLDVVLHRIGVLYGQQGETTKALGYLEQALQTNLEKQSTRGICNIQNDIASIYLRQHQEKKAIDYAQKSLQKATQISAKPIICQSIYILYQAYAQLKDFTQAYVFQEKYLNITKSFLHERISNQVEVLEFGYQLEKKQAILAKVQTEHKLRRNLIYVLFLAIILLGCLIIVLTRGNFRKQKANQLLQVKNQEIAEKSNEIVNQYKELQAQQEEIKTQHQAIEVQNRHITQSINAAKTIQDAILPHKARLEELFIHHFVIYRPKDVVSGDFYWVGKIDNKRIVGAIDCTGHGVSGALMSMIGFTLLNEIINAKRITHPGEILEQLRKELRKAMRQDVTRNREGMDAAFITVEDTPSQQVSIEFAGARRPLWYIEKHCSAMQVMAGSRLSIGLPYQEGRKIETKAFLCKKGTRFYLSSDGFADQNNQAKKKLGSKKLTQLIFLSNKNPLYKQKQVLEYHLDGFMKGTDQRDDILLLGLEV